MLNDEPENGLSAGPIDHDSVCEIERLQLSSLGTRIGVNTVRQTTSYNSRHSTVTDAVDHSGSSCALRFIDTV